MGEIHRRHPEHRRRVKSPTGLLLLRDEPTGTPVGIVTWHDLLRTEMALSEGQLPLRG